MAKLYNCKNGTKEINQAVKNNPYKFPERFSFIINENEINNLEVKIFDLKNKHGGRRYSTRVFTEQGVAMLATILKTSVATKVSINIMDAFVKMRKYIVNNNYNVRISNLETKYIEQDSKIDILFDKLDSQEKTNHIFFEGQIYDAYSLLIDILNESKESIIIIDNYIDKSLLDIVSKINKQILIITSKINEIDLEKYNKQYSNIEIIKSNKYHDRFIIIDKKILYHSGSSFKDLGNKCFGINKTEDKKYLKQLLESI